MTTVTYAHRPTQRRHPALAQVLLGCGIVYGITYVVTNDYIAAAIYNGYSSVDQAVSELSALGAPSRTFLVAITPLFSGLLVVFGLGVRWVSGEVKRLRLAGLALMAFGMLGPLWLFFPMSPRDELVDASARANDVGHIVLTVASVSLIVGSIVLASDTLGTPFRMYSWITVVTTLFFGALTGIVSANLDRGDPTPWMGMLERVSMGAWFLWLA